MRPCRHLNEIDIFREFCDRSWVVSNLERMDTSICKLVRCQARKCQHLFKVLPGILCFNSTSSLPSSWVLHVIKAALTVLGEYKSSLFGEFYHHSFSTVSTENYSSIKSSWNSSLSSLFALPQPWPLKSQSSRTTSKTSDSMDTNSRKW